MSLSDSEQHLLEQMDQELSEADPALAARMRISVVRARLRKAGAIVAVSVFAGLALVLLGVLASSVLPGALGFALMVAGVAYAIRPRVRTGGARRRAPRPVCKPGKAAGSQSFLWRLEQRWDRHHPGG